MAFSGFHLITNVRHNSRRRPSTRSCQDAERWEATFASNAFCAWSSTRATYITTLQLEWEPRTLIVARHVGNTVQGSNVLVTFTNLPQTLVHTKHLLSWTNMKIMNENDRTGCFFHQKLGESKGPCIVLHCRQSIGGGCHVVLRILSLCTSHQNHVQQATASCCKRTKLATMILKKLQPTWNTECVCDKLLRFLKHFWLPMLFEHGSLPKPPQPKRSTNG